jgi:hypothetical protein
MGCATRLTFGIKETIEKSDVDLHNVQFYNSERIVIERAVNKGEKIKETSGKIKLRNGRTIERIVFRKNTPGICVNSYEDNMHMQFEKGEDKLLPFRLQTGLYRLNYQSEKGKYIIRYDTNDYEIVRGLDASLKLQKSSRFTKDKKSRRVKGMKVK